MRKLIAIVLGGALHCGAWAGTPAYAAQAGTMKQAIEARGAQSVVRELRSGDARPWARVLAHIERGERPWLALVPVLRPGTDAASAEALAISVARALPHAPADVLDLVDQGYTLEDLCTSPFIEPGAAVEQRYLRAAQQALIGLRGSAIEARSRACLKRIDRLAEQAGLPRTRDPR